MRKFALAFTLLPLCGMTVQGAELQNSLSSPMIDPAIFRADQIHRLSGRFGDWTVVCDEVKGLKRRYCSLRSAVLKDKAGHRVYADISTGDDGKPAGLLHLPLAIALNLGVSIVDAGPRPAKRAQDAAASRPSADRRSGIATCSERECLAVWNLDTNDIQALNSGRGVRFSYCTLRPGPAEFRVSLRAERCEGKSEGVLSGLGFKAAVLASTN